MEVIELLSKGGFLQIMTNTDSWGVGVGGRFWQNIWRQFTSGELNLCRRTLPMQCLHPGGQKPRKPERQMPDRIGPVWKVVSEDGGSSMKL